MFLVGKWFVFWSVGIRLLIAGIRQVLQPSFTAESIFETNDSGAVKVVTELGSANFCMGLIGALSLYFQSWIMPAALCGGLYLGLAGFKHLAHRHRNFAENAAMVSDLFVFAVLVVFVAGSVAR